MAHKVNSWERRVVCISHPDATGIVESPKFGGIRTERGPAAFVLSVAKKDSVTGFVHWTTEREELAG